MSSGRTRHVAAVAIRALVLGAVGGCALFGGHRDAPRAAREPPSDWRQVATPADRERLRTWRDGWTQAAASVQAAGQGGRMAALGPLLLPDTALADPAPPPGDYACRTFKLGARLPNMPAYLVTAPSPCRVTRAGALLGFQMLGGAQRPIGTFYTGDAARLIFLGTMVLGDETRAMSYGRDSERDMAGALERVGPRRWRLVLPFPHWESTLDVIELVPKG